MCKEIQSYCKARNSNCVLEVLEFGNNSGTLGDITYYSFQQASSYPLVSFSVNKLPMRKDGSRRTRLHVTTQINVEGIKAEHKNSHSGLNQKTT